jgi:two-component system response regulator WspF
VRVAFVSSTPLVISKLTCIINNSGKHKVAWCAGNRLQVLEQCKKNPPDLILVDLGTRCKEKVETIRYIMQRYPCLILVITDSIQKQYDVVFKAMGAGAVDVINTPFLYSGSEAQDAEAVLRKIAMLGYLGKLPAHSRGCGSLFIAEEARPVLNHLVVVGCSSGGPAAVASVLKKLPSEYHAPIVVIQHIDAQFVNSLVFWLDKKTRLSVKVALEGESLQAGHVYIAANDKHLVMNRECKLYYDVEPHETYYRPLVDIFFHSLAAHWHQPVTAILLTGMGDDGAHGLLELRRIGAYTMAQDQGSSVVYGMPKLAAELDAAIDILSLDELSTILRESAFEKAVYYKSCYSGGG